MLILDRAQLAHGEVRLQGELPLQSADLADQGVTLLAPLTVDLSGRDVGDSVLVHASLSTTVRFACRRCLQDVDRAVEEKIDLFFAELDDESDTDGEVYPLPSRGTELDVAEPLREQFVLRLPDYVVCGEECKGLCPQCGADLNTTECGCVPARDPSPWDALKNIKFD
jgi:uncharacterized protein